MSVFVREDFERLKRNILEAAKHNAKALLYEELRASAHDINEMLKNDELTAEEASQEWKELKRQFNRERELIDAERLDSPSSSITQHQNVLSPRNPAPQRR